MSFNLASRTTNAILAILFVVLATVVGTCLYRLCFHPYAKYPGPFLARITNFYAAYQAWTGKIHVDMWQCHERYGPIVRYGPDRILVNSAKAVTDLYGFKTPVIKSTAYDALVHKAPNILTLRERQLHGSRKRVLSQALSDSNIKAFEPAIISKICKFVHVLRSLPQSALEPKGGWSEAIDMARWCDYLTFDIMTSMVFSGDYDMLGEGQYRPAIQAIVDSNVRMGTLFQYPSLRRWKLHEKFFPAAITARGVFLKFVTLLVSTRMGLQKGQDKPSNDVFAFMAKAKDPQTGQGLSSRELAAECTTLIVAGSDTTSTAIAGTLFYLAKHPQYLQQARAELQAQFSRASEIELGNSLSRCKLLAACINEAMRLAPPAGASMWREATADGVMVDEVYVPKGYDVGVGIYSLHHSAEHFPQPFAYRPERWLQTEEGQETRQSAREAAVAAYMPFSRGPRSCIGKGIANAELMLTLATVIWTLEWRFAPGSEPDEQENFELLDHVTGAKQGPVLQFRASGLD
ncbi:hypothetical protein F66182_3275 [Fusarium sp. NRRL 66182]|nr:hypothetical protein F66182_3275 [Fusarium sp. NRRL 66182]